MSIGFLLRSRKDKDALKAKSLDFSGQLLKRTEAENHPGRVSVISERCHRTVPIFEQGTFGRQDGSDAPLHTIRQREALMCLSAFVRRL